MPFAISSVSSRRAKDGARDVCARARAERSSPFQLVTTCKKTIQLLILENRDMEHTLSSR